MKLIPGTPSPPPLFQGVVETESFPDRIFQRLEPHFHLLPHHRFFARPPLRVIGRELPRLWLDQVPRYVGAAHQCRWQHTGKGVTQDGEIAGVSPAIFPSCVTPSRELEIAFSFESKTTTEDSEMKKSAADRVPPGVLHHLYPRAPMTLQQGGIHDTYRLAIRLLQPNDARPASGNTRDFCRDLDPLLRRGALPLPQVPLENRDSGVPGEHDAYS